MKLINFTDLSHELSLKVLSWRNHDEVRRWMYNTEPITQEEHLAFVESLKLRADKRYFVVQSDEEYLGVVDFYNITEDSCEFGLYANPEVKIAGIGRLLDEVCIDYAFNTLRVKTLKLEVYEENKQVINLHKKYGFIIMGEREMNGRSIIQMEKTHENS